MPFTQQVSHYRIYSSTDVGVKLGFHYPSSRPEFTGRVDGPWTRVHFLTPELTARVNGCQKCTRVQGPSTRPVNSGSGNRALESIASRHCFSIVPFSTFRRQLKDFLFRKSFPNITSLVPLNSPSGSDFYLGRCKKNLDDYDYMHPYLPISVFCRLANKDLYEMSPKFRKRQLW